MAENVLQVWLAGKHLAELERLRNGKLRLRFSETAISKFGIGSRVLSLSLPVKTERIEEPSLDRFVEGLLPENPLRSVLERDNQLRRGDSFELLKVLGLECAGAIQFTVGELPPDNGNLRVLSRTEARELIRNLPTLTPPDGLPVTASLGGVQAKVLLTKIESGWAWPAGGAMSTHIIKPEPNTDIALPGLIQAEEWTLRLAKSIGIPAANASIEDFDGRKAIVVERYDRVSGTRIHQEDFTQALSFAPSEKYETSLGNQRRLLRIAIEAGTQSRNESSFKLDLLKAVTFNLVLGNGDAHSKNYALTIDHRNGVFALAPLYDSAPIFLMNNSYSSAGHSLNGQIDLKYLGLKHVIEEAVSWGVNRTLATVTVLDITSAIADSATQVEFSPYSPEAAPTIGEELPKLVQERAKRLLTEGSREAIA